MTDRMTCETLRPTLETMLRGDIGALSPDQVERLEAHLNECAACAAMLAAELARPESCVAAVSTATPGEAVWERVWENIEAARDANVSASRRNRLEADTTTDRGRRNRLEADTTADRDRRNRLEADTTTDRGRRNRLEADTTTNRAGDAVGTAAGAAPKTITLRGYRRWSVLAAAAVLILMVGWWRLGVGPGLGDSALILAGADDVRIEALEVFGDATAMVMTVGENDDIPVIWVVDDEGA